MSKKPQWLVVGPLDRSGRAFGGKSGMKAAENYRDRLDATHGARAHYICVGEGDRYGWSSTQTHEQALEYRAAQLARPML